MVIREVLSEEPLQVSLVQRNDLIEEFAAAASHPALRDSVLRGTLNRGLYAGQILSMRGLKMHGGRGE